MAAYSYKTSQAHVLSNNPLDSGHILSALLKIIPKTRISGFHRKINQYMLKLIFILIYNHETSKKKKSQIVEWNSGLNLVVPVHNDVPRESPRKQSSNSLPWQCSLLPNFQHHHHFCCFPESFSYVVLSQDLPMRAPPRRAGEYK